MSDFLWINILINSGPLSMIIPSFLFFSFLLLVASASLVTGTLDFLVVSYYPTYSPGQNAGEGSLSLLQGSSLSRDQTQVSRIAGRFFTSWATREAQEY